MKNSARSKVLFVVVLLSVVAGMVPASAAPRDNSVAAQRARYWTEARRDAAIPRDLVVDKQGRGYLRQADGTWRLYGSSTPQPRDTAGPAITNPNPAEGASLTSSSHTFSATVSDIDGVKSVTFTIGPDGGTKTSYTAVNTKGTTTWSATVSGLTSGPWDWKIDARDGVKRKGGNASSVGPIPFSVSLDASGGTDGGGTDGGGTTTEPDVVTNAPWTYGGDVQNAAGRIYFEMPQNSSLTKWGGYVCSGTTAYDETTARSIIITAAHCVYDDAYKVFARNVLFIPNQDGTTGTGTDTNCSNDPLGCWAPTHGVVDDDWANQTWPANIPWDYAYYVAPDTGWSGDGDKSLDGTVNELSVKFEAAPTLGVKTHALGYSYSDDPNFMYCAEGLAQESSYSDWWLGQCGLSGGASGGPWVQTMDLTTGSGPIVSVNSWGYRDSPGMAGPRLHDTSARCLFDIAKTNATNTTRGYKATC